MDVDVERRVTPNAALLSPLLSYTALLTGVQRIQSLALPTAIWLQDSGDASTILLLICSRVLHYRYAPGFVSLDAFSLQLLACAMQVRQSSYVRTSLDLAFLCMAMALYFLLLKEVSVLCDARCLSLITRRYRSRLSSFNALTACCYSQRSLA